jgi:hypothetical protein
LEKAGRAGEHPVKKVKKVYLLKVYRRSGISFLLYSILKKM